jgi:hypothetical protein
VSKIIKREVKMMYKFALFLHITGALLLFAGLGIELISLLNIKTANKQILIPKILRMNKVYTAAMVIIILPGIHMMSEVWGFNSWIIMAFIGIIINSVLFMNITRRRLRFYLKSSAKEETNLSFEKDAALNDPILWLSVNIRISVIIGIIFLMTIKPEMLWSIVTILSSIILGLIFTVLKKKLKNPKGISLVNNI